MASPFAIFRKHQKEFMVIITGMAMFSWLVIDTINGRRGDASPSVLVAFIALIGAGAGYVWNARDEKKSYGWLNGAVLGAVIGLVMVFSAQRKEPGIDSAAGKISVQKIYELRAQREIANGFVQRAFFKRENVNEFLAQFLIPRYLFGGESTQELVAMYLLQKEADQFGITVSNDYINKYIDEVSENRLDDRSFTDTCRQMGVSEVQLFEVLRQELRARLTMQMLNPASLYLPEQFWSDYQKFNVRHSIDATAIPVEAFMAEVDTPSEGDLKKLFEEFKAVYPNGGTPGFKVPEKKRVAFLTAAYEQFEKQVGEISDEDLKKLYEARKETSFKADLLPELSPGKAGDKSLPSLDDLKLPEPSKPTDNKAEEDKKDAEKSATPDAEKKSEPAKTTEKPVDDKKPADSGSDGGEETQDSNPPPKAEEKSASTKPAEAPPESPAKPTTAENAEKSAEKEPAKDGAEKPVEAPKYKPFEDVRDQLRDEVLRERTLALLKTAIDDAKLFVADEDFKIGDQFSELSKEERGKKLAESVKKYAQEKGLTYEESSLLSFEEFSNSKDLKLALATEPMDLSSGRFEQPRSVSAAIFSEGSVAYVPDKAELAQPSGDLHFVYWVTEVAAEHVAEFTEEGVRQSVEKAFRMRAGRGKAEERAKTLAKTAEETVAKQPLSEAFGGQTVTGHKESLELTVISTPPFSWLRQSVQGLQMNPMQQRPQIEFGFVPGIDKVNDDFMKSVFEMAVGQVEVLPNSDKTTYYVVHLKERTPSDKAEDAGMVALYERFLNEDVSRSPIYGGLAQSQAAMIRSRWIGDFMRKYGVDVNQFEQF